MAGSIGCAGAGATPPPISLGMNEDVWSWSDGHDFVPDVHYFDSSSSDITPDF